MPFRWPTRLRVVQSCLALIVWFALLLQLYLSIHHSLRKGGSALYGVWMYLAFFTILTNLIVASVLSVQAIAAESRAGRFCSRASTIAGVACNIALVSIGYNLLLRDSGHPHGLHLVADVLLHDIVPPLFVIYAHLFARDGGSLRGRLQWAAWPIVYFAYVLVRGFATGFYPYPFLNVASLGYAGVLANSIGLLAGYLLLAVMLTGLERVRLRAPATA